MFNKSLNNQAYSKPTGRIWTPMRQEPITRSLQLPHIPVTAFSQTDLFLV